MIAGYFLIKIIVTEDVIQAISSEPGVVRPDL